MLGLHSKSAVVAHKALWLVLFGSMMWVHVVTAQSTPVCSYTVVNSYPHDANAYTQGLIYLDSVLYESTGLNGESSLRKVELSTGTVLQIHELSEDLFGEGLTWREGDQLVQLTWHAGVAYVYDRIDFSQQGSLSYTGEGWGLTNDGRWLISSSGSPTLRYRDPITFVEQWSLPVYSEFDPLLNLNELEIVEGEIFANIYTTDRIARIDPTTGTVIAWLDLSGLLDPPDPNAEVLNGIAYDKVGRRLFVTGKFWHSLYEIQMVDCPALMLFNDGFDHGGTARWSETVTVAEIMGDAVFCGLETE